MRKFSSQSSFLLPFFTTNLGTGRTEHMCEVRIFNSKAVTTHPLQENKPDFLPPTLVYYPIVWKMFENRTAVHGGLQCVYVCVCVCVCVCVSNKEETAGEWRYLHKKGFS